MSRFTGALDAWHGSHADFDEFRDDKINTGEGAQVYGHGHYVGEAKGTGEQYRDSVSRKRGLAKGYYFDRDPAYGPITIGQIVAHNQMGTQGKFVSSADRMLLQVMGHNNLPSLTPDEQRHLMMILDQAHDQYDVNISADPRSFLDHAKDMHEDVLSDGPFDPDDEEHVESKSFLDAYPRLEKWVDAVKKAVGGRLYQLKVDLSEPHIIDWEEQLQHQHPDVVDKLKTASSMDIAADHFKTMSAGDFYKSILSGVNGHGSPQAASKALLDSGIHAIRYLDQHSRNRQPRLYFDGQILNDDNFEQLTGQKIPDYNHKDAHPVVRALSHLSHNKTHDPEDLIDIIRQQGLADFPSDRYSYNNWADWIAANKHRIEVKPAKPTYNYVVFDPKLIKMVRKYDDRGNVVHDYTQASGTELRPVDHDPFAEEKK